jgi:hypothetical protein
MIAQFPFTTNGGRVSGIWPFVSINPFTLVMEADMGNWGGPPSGRVTLYIAAFAAAATGLGSSR